VGEHGVTSASADTGSQQHYKGRRSCSHCSVVRNENKELRRTVADQARLLSLLAPETHPASPSLNCIYWLYAPTKWHSKSWRTEWNRIMPSLDGLGHYLAPDITPIIWEQHRARRRQQEQRGGGAPCEHTLNIELGRLKTMLDWAVANQMIKFNPLAAAAYVKTKSQRETAPKPYDVEDLLVAVEDVRDKRLCDGDDDGRRSKQLRAFVLLLFDSMLRFNEARHLRRDQIGPTGDYIVPGDHCKSGRPRTVTITPRTLEAIDAVPRHPHTQLLFASPETGALLGEQTLRGWYNWAKKAAGLDARAAPGEKVTPHCLRHGGATAADAAGARPGALQAALGHAHMRTTERYLHRESAESAHHVAAVMQEATRAPPQRARIDRHKK